MRRTASLVLAVMVALLLVGAGCGGDGSGAGDGGTDSDTNQNDGVTIWFFGHSGWGLEVGESFLIFDYDPQEPSPESPGLADGYVDPAEIADKTVYVFTTHPHLDHYSQVIYDWQDSLDDIHYIFGWTEALDPQHTAMEPHEQATVGDAEICTIAATDLGVGFLVEIHGLVVFHGGDHAHWGGAYALFTDEIDLLAETGKEIDLAFLAVTTGTCDPTASITEGVYYAIETLNPNVMFPMHCGDDGQVYQAFAEEAAGQGFATQIWCAQNLGDSFTY